MNVFHRNAPDRGAGGFPTAPHGPAAVAAAALALGLGAAPVHAGGFNAAESAAPASQPAAVANLAEDPYSADPAFAAGAFIEDAFAGDSTAPNTYFDGKKVVRLGNGDLVVAALVRKPDGSQNNGFANIGLVRYNAAGTQRLTWSNPTPAYAHFNNQYVVYPNSATANFSWIQDIKAIDGKILVAANLNFGGSDDIDTTILVFGEDGSFKTADRVFGGGGAEYVGGMEVYKPAALSSKPQVLVVATNATRESQGGGIGRPLFRRYSLEAAGTLSDETGVVALNTHWCDDPGRDCRPAGIALGTRGSIGTPSIYVVNRYYQPAADQPGWSIAVSRIDANGAADASWPGEWWYSRDGGGAGAHRNWPVALAVRTSGLGIPASPYRDEVFVVSEIDRSCGAGIVVNRFDHDGATRPSQIFGGSTATGAICNALGRPADYPVDVALGGGRLAVAGFGKHGSILPGGEDSYNGFVAVLDASTGGTPPLTDLRDYTFPIGGPRERHSGFWGIAPTSAGRFVVAGDVRFTNADATPAALRGKSRVAVLGIAPDRIFGSGFGGTPTD